MNKYSLRENLYQELSDINLIAKMDAGGLLNSRYIDTETKKLNKLPAIRLEPYWVYTNPNPELLCTEWQGIVKGFRFIPKTCRNCYKVVVMPKSFHELMQLYDLQQEMVKENPRCWCKCGIEKREFVPRHYGGYFYTQGLEVGKTRWKTVKDRVHEINKDINVILKRYCTEFELLLGPSDKYEPPAWADELEKDILSNIVNVGGGIRQPQFVINNTIQSWMVFAWGRGDKTVMLYNNGKPLLLPSVTYHEGG